MRKVNWKKRMRRVVVILTVVAIALWVGYGVAIGITVHQAGTWGELLSAFVMIVLFPTLFVLMVLSVAAIWAVFGLIHLIVLLVKSGASQKKSPSQGTINHPHVLIDDFGLKPLSEERQLDGGSQTAPKSRLPPGAGPSSADP
jgi:uncharacterized membrane protein